MSFRTVLDPILLRDDPDVDADLRRLLSSETGIAAFPEMWALLAMGTLGKMHKENFDHSIRVAVAAPPRLRVRLIALCHDIGKAMTRKIENGEVTFKFHEDRGALLVAEALPRLGYSTELVAQVSAAVGMSGRAARYSDSWTDASVRRLVRDADGFLDDLLDFVAVDCTSKHEHNRVRARTQVAALRARISEVESLDAERARRPLLNGAEVMELLGVGPGPIVGEAVKLLLAERPATRAEAEALVHEMGEASLAR